MAETREQLKACATPIIERAQALRDHYEKAAAAIHEWHNQIPVAIDLWEQEQLRRAEPVRGEDADVSEWDGPTWAKALEAARDDMMWDDDYDPATVAHVMTCCAAKLRALTREPPPSSEGVPRLDVGENEGSYAFGPGAPERIELATPESQGGVSGTQEGSLRALMNEPSMFSDYVPTAEISAAVVRLSPEPNVACPACGLPLAARWLTQDDVPEPELVDTLMALDWRRTFWRQVEFAWLPEDEVFLTRWIAARTCGLKGEGSDVSSAVSDLMEATALYLRVMGSPPVAQAETGSPGLTPHADTLPVAQEREPERWDEMLRRHNRERCVWQRKHGIATRDQQREWQETGKLPHAASEPTGGET
jgi:hypothetical protein